MTQEKIVEYNKRCAEFLGAEINNVLERIYIDKMKDDDMMFHNFSVTLQTYEWNGATNIHYIPFDMLQFHSDWNWIMELLLQIQSLPLDEHTHTIWNLKFRESKEAVVQAINQFLIWYNNGTKL